MNSTSRKQAVTVAGVAALIVVNCTGRDEQPASHFTVADSAGVAIIQNQARSVAVTLRARAYRIGGVDGPQTLHRVSHVFLEENGGIGVVETSSNLIRFFDAMGNEVRQIGGTGDGPGEFRGLWWASREAGDTLVVFDINAPTQVSVFDGAGRFIRRFPTPRLGRGEPTPRGALQDGAILLLMQSTAGGPQSADTYDWGLYTADSDGTVQTDLGTWPIGRLVRGSLVFGYQASFAAADDRFFYTPGNRYEVRVHASTGGLRQIIRVDRSRVAVTPTDIDDYKAAIEARLAQPRRPGELIRRPEELQFADSMPAYTAVLPNRGHGFWARLGAPQYTSINLWDVFDATGVHLGAIQLPRGFRPTSVRDGLVAGISLDQYDVEYVEVYEWVASDRSANPASGVHSR